MSSSELLHLLVAWVMVFGLGAYVGWGLTYAWHLDQKIKEADDAKV